MAHSNKTQVDLMRPFIKNFLQFLCAIYGTNVQIERTWKDSPRAYICCRTEITTLLALSLRKHCLRKFRCLMKESSIVQFNCSQILPERLLDVLLSVLLDVGETRRGALSAIWGLVISSLNPKHRFLRFRYRLFHHRCRLLVRFYRSYHLQHSNSSHFK